jgi:hypothetical protein
MVSTLLNCTYVHPMSNDVVCSTHPSSRCGSKYMTNSRQMHGCRNGCCRQASERQIVKYQHTANDGFTLQNISLYYPTTLVRRVQGLPWIGTSVDQSPSVATHARLNRQRSPTDSKRECGSCAIMHTARATWGRSPSFLCRDFHLLC